MALAAAVTIDPSPLVLRRALAGSALGWLALFGPLAALAVAGSGLTGDTLSLIVAGGRCSRSALAGLAATTGDVTDDRTDAFGRVGAVVVFGVAILMAAGAAVIIVSLGRAIWRAFTTQHGVDRLPWGTAWC